MTGQSQNPKPNPNHSPPGQASSAPVELDFSPFTDDEGGPGGMGAQRSGDNPLASQQEGGGSPFEDEGFLAAALDPVQNRFVADVLGEAASQAFKPQEPSPVGGLNGGQNQGGGDQDGIDWGPSLDLGFATPASGAPVDAVLGNEAGATDFIAPDIAALPSLSLGEAGVGQTDESDGPSFSSGQGASEVPDFDPAHDQPTLATNNQLLPSVSPPNPPLPSLGEPNPPFPLSSPPRAPLPSSSLSVEEDQSAAELPLLGFQNLNKDSSLGQRDSLVRAAAQVMEPKVTENKVTESKIEKNLDALTESRSVPKETTPDLPPLSQVAEALFEPQGTASGSRPKGLEFQLGYAGKMRALVKKSPSLFLALSLGLVTLVGLSIYEQFLGESQEPGVAVTPVVQNPTGEKPPLKPGIKPSAPTKKSSTAVQSKKRDTQKKLSAKPLEAAPGIEKALPHSSGLNQLYFDNIDKALLSGVPEAAVRAFKRPRPAPLADERETLLAAQLEVRYYLLVGQYKKVQQKIGSRCAEWNVDNAPLCLYLVRALLNEGAYTEARAHLSKARVATADYEGLIEREWALLNRAALALSRPSVQGAHQLLGDLFQAPPLNAEWQRQKAHWFMKTLALMGRKERAQFSYQVFLNPRSEGHRLLLKAIAEKRIETIDDPLFSAFLRYLNKLAEGTIALPRIRSEQQTDAALAALVFNAVVDVVTQSPQKVLREVTLAKQHQEYKKIVNLLEVNLLINENDFVRAQRALMSLPGPEQVRYDWNLVRARLAWHHAASGLRSVAASQLEQMLLRDPKRALDFKGWLAVAKLKRLLGQPAGEALKRANRSAVTLSDFGELAVENIKILQASGKQKEAHKLALASLKRIPHHGPLLQAAGEAASQVGANLTAIEAAQEQIPPQYWHRVSDLPLVSEDTLMDMLLRL